MKEVDTQRALFCMSAIAPVTADAEKLGKSRRNDIYEPMTSNRQITLMFTLFGFALILLACQKEPLTSAGVNDMTSNNGTPKASYEVQNHSLCNFKATVWYSSNCVFGTVPTPISQTVPVGQSRVYNIPAGNVVVRVDVGALNWQCSTGVFSGVRICGGCQNQGTVLAGGNGCLIDCL
jgi:hypothetical protein